MFGLLLVLLSVASMVMASYRLGQTKRGEERYNLLVVSMVVGGACTVSGLFSLVSGWNPLQSMGNKMYHAPQQTFVARG